MIYSEPLYNQISRFLDSVGMGFILCGLYIAVKVLFRAFGKGRITAMVSDGIFCLITAFVSFFYMLIENNGTVRLNLAVGQLVGGLLLYFTVGRFLLKVLYIPGDILNGLLRCITYPFRSIVKAIYGSVSGLFRRLRRRIINRKGPKSKKE